jgi:hypothetical protein
MLVRPREPLVTEQREPSSPCRGLDRGNFEVHPLPETPHQLCPHASTCLHVLKFTLAIARVREFHDVLCNSAPDMLLHISACNTAVASNNRRSLRFSPPATVPLRACRSRFGTASVWRGLNEELITQQGEIAPTRVAVHTCVTCAWRESARPSNFETQEKSIYGQTA